MATIVELAKALAEIGWPVAFLVFAWWFYGPVAGLLNALRQQVVQGASVKYGDLELKGISLADFPLHDSSVYQCSAADSQLLDARNVQYRKQKNIFLVHRVKRTENLHSTGLPIYDVSVYLIGHKHYGALNDIEMVEYYFGKYFQDAGDHAYGSKFIVKNSKNGFAVKTTAYGPTLCEARVEYHDGTSAVMSRYLDFEGTGYSYDAALVSRADGGAK